MYEAHNKLDNHMDMILGGIVTNESLYLRIADGAGNWGVGRAVGSGGAGAAAWGGTVMVAVGACAVCCRRRRPLESRLRARDVRATAPCRATCGCARSAVICALSVW